MTTLRQFSAQDYAIARNKYRPRKIRVLLIAESPPSSGGFFYFTRTIGKDPLFRETMKALKLWPISNPMPKDIDKRPLLKEFQSRGFFLIDTSPTPVDKLSDRERRATIVQDSSSLAQTVKDLDPNTVAIVKKTVYKPVRTALENIGLGRKILNRTPLPFPSHGNQRRYRIQLRRMINKIDKSREL